MNTRTSPNTYQGVLCPEVKQKVYPIAYYMCLRYSRQLAWQYHHKSVLKEGQRWKLEFRRPFWGSKKGSWTNMLRRGHWWSVQHHRPIFSFCLDYRIFCSYRWVWSKTRHRSRGSFPMPWGVWFMFNIILII